MSGGGIASQIVSSSFFLRAVGSPLLYAKLICGLTPAISTEQEAQSLEMSNASLCLHPPYENAMRNPENCCLLLGRHGPCVYKVREIHL